MGNWRKTKQGNSSAIQLQYNKIIEKLTQQTKEKSRVNYNLFTVNLEVVYPGCG